jgi:NADPH-dependent ferric siderophore reductase
MTFINRNIERVRHDTRVRLLQVSAIADITPLMRRITLSGPDLAGFVSLGYSDHIKVFVAADGKPLPKPMVTPEGLAFPDDVPRPLMRDYTPRRHDAQAGTLDIDFVLHGHGSAASWAAQAEVGQNLMIGGPRGSLIVPTNFDWYFLAGDETALPAIGRRIEELPAGARAIAVIEVANAAEQQQFETKADVKIVWVHRDGTEPGTGDQLLSASAALDFPAGDSFAFVAAESRVTKALRQHLVAERGFNPAWLKAAGYWVRGEAGAHD